MKAKLSRGPARRRAPTQVYSTSEARANFAETLEAVQIDGAIIGFDRYGRTVAALVPLDAIYMLAGQAAEITPDARRRIERAAKNLVQDIQHLAAQPKGEPERKPKRKPRAGA